MTALKQHRLSARFPSMPDEEYAALLGNMKEHGQEEFIIMYEGKVLDGWHRYRACVELGITPKMVNFRGKDAEASTWSRNFSRRHLTASQRAMLVVQRAEWQKTGRPETGKNLPLTNEKMANEAQTSTQTIKDAKTVEANGSEALKDAIANKEIVVSVAAKVTTLPKAKQVKAAKEKKPKPERAVKPKAGKKTEPDENLAKELEAADKEIRSLQSLNESLKKDDSAKEITKLHTRIAGLEGRLQSAITTKNEAEKEAKYATGLLGQIRKALKVEKNSQILEAIRQ